MTEGAPGGKRDPAVIEARVRRRRRWVIFRMLRVLVIAASMVVAAGVVGAVAVSRTEAGRRLVLQRALRFVSPRINGTVVVGALGPAGLLGGARIYDIQVMDGDGHRVLSIDSLQIRYSLLELVGGSPAVSDLSLWRPELVLEREDDGRVNVAALLDTGPVDMDTTLVQDSTALARPFRIRGATIHDGVLISRLDPADERRFEDIDAELGRVDVPTGGGEGTADLQSFSVDMVVKRGRARIEEARGELTLDDGTLTAELPTLRFPGSNGGGRVFVEWGQDGWRATSEFTFERLDLEDLAWMDARIPEGAAAGELRLTVDPGGILLNSSGIEVDLGPEGRLSASGGLVRRGGWLIRNASLSPAGVPVAALDPWLPSPLGVEGSLTGDLQVHGPPDSLALSGALTLMEPAGRDTLVHAAGSGTYRGPGRVSEVSVSLAPLDYGLLRRLAPELDGVRGRGTLSVEADGALRSGMDVRLAATQALPESVTSSVSLEGQLFGARSVSVVDLSGTVDPLSLTAMSTMFPELGMAGEVIGQVSIAGPMDALQIGADLETQAGPVDLVATFDARQPGREYDIEGTVDAFRLSELFPQLPDTTVVSGHVALRGTGSDPETIQARLDVQAWASRIGRVDVDTVDASLWVDEEGRLNVERAYARTEGAVLEAQGGRLGLAPGSYGEGVNFTVTAESIEGFRPVFMGENLISGDDLDELERLALEMEGVAIDTLPRAVDIRFQGALDGSIAFEGSLRELTIRGGFLLDGPAYGPHEARRLRGDVVVRGIVGLPSDSVPRGPISFEGTISGDSIVALDRQARSASLEGSYATDGSGRVQITVDQAPEESYEAQGVFQLGDSTGRINLDRLTLRFPDRRWNLRGPASFVWSPEAIVVRDFGLIRPGGDGLRIAADGRLSRDDTPSDFSLQLADLDLAVLGHLLRLETVPAGLASLSLEASGTGLSPRWETEFLAEEVRYGILDLQVVSGDGVYEDSVATGRVEARDGARVTLSADGSIPLDLRLEGVDERFPDEPLRLDIVADSFPLATLLSVLNNVEDVAGTVSGTVAVGGRLSDLEPDGILRAEDGTMLISSLGIRLTEMAMDMDLQPDGVVRVDGRGRSQGTVAVRGTVDLSELRNPVFDLAFWPDELQVVDRRDIETAVSGDSITLTGRFNSPLIEGNLEVIEGTVFIEEFQRASQAVSFYDPFFSQAITEARAIAEGGQDAEAIERARNPFLRSLRVLVGVNVSRDNWLRSREMNVETSGDLNLTFDRLNGQLVLQGEMNVVRGTYNRLPRTFNMTEGTFRFIGTPGFNPDMDVTAVNRLQTREGQPLTITANMSGTLLAPQIALTSDSEVAMSEADLVSYLVLGQPASALVNETRTASIGAAANLALGYTASQIGYLLAPDLPIDYLSVSQSERVQATSALDNAAVQVEAGVYVSDEVFLAGLFQRGACADPTSVTNSWGVRVEVQVPQDVTLEGFLEDRCTREGFRGLGDLSFQLAKVWGFSLFREWGY